jgi:hypothetical protein
MPRTYTDSASGLLAAAARRVIESFPTAPGTPEDAHEVVAILHGMYLATYYTQPAELDGSSFIDFLVSCDVDHDMVDRLYSRYYLHGLAAL